jgi:hypothetical protein
MYVFQVDDIILFYYLVLQMADSDITDHKYSFGTVWMSVLIIQFGIIDHSYFISSLIIFLISSFCCACELRNTCHGCWVGCVGVFSMPNTISMLALMLTETPIESKRKIMIYRAPIGIK